MTGFAPSRRLRRWIFWGIGGLALLLVGGIANLPMSRAFAADVGEEGHQLATVAQLVGRFEGYASICHIPKTSNFRAYQEDVKNAKLIVAARYRQLGLNTASLKAEERIGRQQVESDHRADANAPDCRSSYLLHVFDINRFLARQVVAFVRLSPRKLSAASGASDRIAPDATEDDFQAFPFAGIVGSLRGDAEICGVKNSEYDDVLQGAEQVVNARFHQLGLNDRSIIQQEETGYRGSFANHAANPTHFPNCAYFSRQIENVEGWTVRQGAVLIRKSTNE